MKLKDVLNLISIHIAFLILGSFIFIASFHSFLFESIDVLFFRGILLLIATCFIISIILIIFKRCKFGRSITYRDIILSVVIIMNLNIVFFTHVPVTADRSVSIFILGFMNDNCNNSISREEMENIFINKYVHEYGAMQRRFDEQIVSGNIIQEGTKYKISGRGILLMKFYDKIADLFSIDKKFIHPTK